VLSGWKVSHCLFPLSDKALDLGLLVAAIGDVVNWFNGEYLSGDPDNSQRRLVIMVAAMSLESLVPRLKRDDAAEAVLFVGDREDIQLAAIAAGAFPVVITGGMSVSAKVRGAAQEAGTRLVFKPL
jgi:predicted transcriptional regulator